jgi:hypothetical protein
MQQWGKSDPGGEGAVLRPVGAPVKRRQTWSDAHDLARRGQWVMPTMLPTLRQKE